MCAGMVFAFLGGILLGVIATILVVYDQFPPEDE